MRALTGVSRRRAALPLAVWAGLWCAASVLATVGATAAVLLALGRMDGTALEALVAGAVVGLLLCLGAVTGAARLAARRCAACTPTPSCGCASPPRLSAVRATGRRACG